MRALVLQHIAIEGPGTLAPLLQARGWDIETVALYEGHSLPAEPRAYQAILIMGGPMGVYDEADYPFLRAEHRFLTQAIAQDVPLLGICLGAQLLAKALGARVFRNPTKEIGWYTVDLTQAGGADPLFAGLASPITVFQWHGDAFELPRGATLLASAPQCANQVFRYGTRVYGLLFHLELTPEMMQQWITAFQEELRSLRGQIDPAQIVADIPHYQAAYKQVGQQVFTNLVTHLWEPRMDTRQHLG